MLRSVACELAKADTHPFPNGSEIYITGHLQDSDEQANRFSYLPLPSIGHHHVDGRIRRFLIAEPHGGGGTHAHWAQTRLMTAVLRDRDGNERGVLGEPWRSSSKAMIGSYTGEARRWSTVTPVILPGFDDGKRAKAERLSFKALAQAGIPEGLVGQLAMVKEPLWPGSSRSNQYFVPDYLRHLGRWHVQLELRAAVPGPLAVGARRHVGLGLFAAADHGRATTAAAWDSLGRFGPKS